MINVCFITDENYVLLTLVAIKSLIVNSKTALSINVVSSDLSHKYQDLFHQLETNNAKINIIHTQNPCENITIKHGYVTKAAFLKFCLPNIFKDLDKILYLDSDTLCLNDLKELYDTDLEDCYAGVAEDISVSTTQTYFKEEGLEKYFNSGVILMNLAKMRENSTTDKLIEYANNSNHQLFMDQDAFNFVFKEKVKWLSIKYNFLNLVYNQDLITSYLNISAEEYCKITNSIIISHYAGVIWDRFIEISSEENFNLWYKYFNMLPDSDFKINSSLYLCMQYNKFQTRALSILNNKIISMQQEINQLKNKENIFQKIFSVRNRDGHKIVTILFIKMKFKIKNKK